MLAGGSALPASGGSLVVAPESVGVSGSGSAVSALGGAVVTGSFAGTGCVGVHAANAENVTTKLECLERIE